MHSRFHRGVRHARRGLFYTGALVVILLAIAVAVADRLLPLVQEHPEKIAAWLIERAGRPVYFDSAEAHWTRRGPVFVLHGVRIGTGKQQLDVDRAELLVAMYSGIFLDHPFTELRLRGLALTLERDAAGQWHFVGLSGPKTGSSQNPLHDLEGLGELQVADAKLTVLAPDMGIAFTSPRVDVRLRVSQDRMRAGVRAYASHGPPLFAVLDFDRRNNNGQLWVGGSDVDLAPWSPLLGYAGIVPAHGRGRIGLWTTLRDRRVVSVQADADVRDVLFRSHEPILEAGGPVLPQVALAGLRVTARWDAIDDGWRVVAPTLRLHTATGDEQLDGLALQVAGGIDLAATHADIGSLLSIAMLSERAPRSLRGWLSQASPRLRLSKLDLDGRFGGPMRGSAILDDASWLPVGETPALHGLSGILRFDRDAISLELATQKPMPHPSTILWPPAFGEPLPMQFDGTLTAWRDGAAWTLESSSLRTHNADVDLDTRFAMRFDGDGTRPRLDLFTTVKAAHVPATKRYWIRNRMPAKTVEWLDNALEGGELTGAHVMVAGDLDDWPFRHNEGLFEAAADLADVQLRFHPDWPRADHLNGRLTFVDEGMRFDGDGSILGIKMPQIAMQISSFHLPILDIQANGIGSGKQLLELLRQSPLKKRYGDTFAALGVEGEGQRVSMHLVQPLKHELGERTVDGDVQLSHARLSDSRWSLLFTDVDGRIHYDQGGLLADALAVRVDGDPGSLRLAIGDATGDPATVVSAELRGTFPTATLLQHAPALDWLKPIVKGRTAWTVDVRVPRTSEGQRATTSQLSVSSDLRGAELVLPAPLNKPANKALPLQVHTLLPASAGDIDVRLGDQMTMRGHYDDVQPFRGLIVFGGAAANGQLPAQGLQISGNVTELDTAGWVAYASKTKTGSGGLQNIDLQVGSLSLGGSHFADTRVRMAQLPDATTLRLDGDALSGSVVVPTDLTRGIRGQFDRLYWPGAAPPTASGRSAPADSDTDLDPTRVPPIHLDVADLRFGDAKLGQLVLQTRPIAQGLRIEQLDATAKSQSVSATGDWTHNGPATRTRLAIDFRAESLGKMLDAFGFKGVVAAGNTHATLQGGWAGSPTSFRLSALDGTLDLDVGTGRLLEVKPGAGRILGLVSLAELPRRLTLDFRDFFDKGFSFNTVRGRFVFANGQARTDDLAIKGPAADVHVSGSADLVAQKYDQVIEVLPKTGGLVTAVGAIAGGPIGAAVGAVAGQVFQHPLQQMGRKRYHVTGPWSNPDVQQLPGGSSNAAPPPASG